MATGDTKTESYLRIAAEGERDDLPTDNCCNTKTQNLILGVANRIMDVEDEVEELKNNPDVVDVVGTYQDLEAYDTSTLTDKDVIRVLEDSTHDNKSTFYRWNASTSQFDYIGEAGGGGPNVVQVIGSSTTDVMSQDATSKLVFNGGSYPIAIRIGNDNNTNSMDTISIGAFNEVRGSGSVSIGANAEALVNNSVALGGSAKAIELGSVALGYAAHAGIGNYNVAIGYGAAADSRVGQVSFKKNSSYNSASYNNTGYMLVAGVHDGLDAHDAVNLGQLDGRVKQNAGAPTTATVGTVGQLLEDTTNGKLYQCTTVDTTDPSNPSYTWAEVGGGGGGTLYGTVGQNTDGAMTQKATTDMVYGANSVKNSGLSGSQTAGVYIGGYDENGNLFSDPSTGKKDYVWISPKLTSQYRGPQDNSVCINGATAGPYSVVVHGSASGNFVGQSYVTSVGYCGQSDVEGMSTFGYDASANGGGEAFGRNASAIGEKSVAIGHDSIALWAAKHSVALGERAEATREGEVNVGYSFNTSQYHGYNNSQYRVIGGVYDGQLAHDAVTVGQINSLIDAINTATGSNIAHIGA